MEGRGNTIDASSKDDDDDFNFTKEIILARVRFRTRSTMMHRAPTHFFIRCSLLLYYSSKWRWNSWTPCCFFSPSLFAKYFDFITTNKVKNKISRFCILCCDLFQNSFEIAYLTNIDNDDEKNAKHRQFQLYSLLIICYFKIFK